MKETIKKGSLFNTSWGYDQTNYDFIVVKSISPTGKTCLCQKAIKTQVDSTQQTDILKPKAEGFGKEFRMKIEKNGDRIYLRGSYPFLSRFEDDWTAEQMENWQKSTRLDTFSLCHDDETYHQTNPMFGH